MNASISLPVFSPSYMVKSTRSCKTIQQSDIAYFYRDMGLNHVVSFSNECFITDADLDKLEETLDPLSFFRINSKFLVSIRAVAEVHDYKMSRQFIKLYPATPRFCAIQPGQYLAFQKWMSLSRKSELSNQESETRHQVPDIKS